jgi:hypothetical protein
MAKKETTKSFVLRLNAATMAAVEKWAADEFRSTNGQLQWIITEALRKNRRLPKQRPASVKKENEQQDSIVELTKKE